MIPRNLRIQSQRYCFITTCYKTGSYKTIYTCFLEISISYSQWEKEGMINVTPGQGPE